MIRRTSWLLSILCLFSIAVWAQTGRPYNNGYQAGYSQGQQDAQSGQPANLSRSRVYQRATQGWDPDVTSRADYRATFRQGFQNGYQAGYSASANNAGYGQQQRYAQNSGNVSGNVSNEAFHNGYQAGYNQGRRDAGASYNVEASTTYQDASLGFDAARFSSIDQYRGIFRDGFRSGYNDGYYGRAYDERRNVPRLDNQGRPIASTVAPAGQGHPFSEGYEEGYRHGQQDMSSGRGFRARQLPMYRRGLHGYNSEEGSRVAYRRQFRRGFVEGYDDGFNNRQARITINNGYGYGARGLGYGGETYQPQSGTFVVPAGTVLRLRLDDHLNSSTAQPGDTFTATVTDSVPSTRSNQTAIPAGAKVLGTVTSAEPAGLFGMGNNAQLRLNYEAIDIPGSGRYQLEASTSGTENNNNVGQSEGEIRGRQSTERKVGTVAAGAVLGALIGGIAGGGKGAGIGAAVGSAAGIGTVLATKNGGNVDLPAGSMLEMRLDNPLYLRR